MIDSIDSEDLSMMLREARDKAIQEMAKEAATVRANAVIGVKIDYKTVGYYQEGEEKRAMLVIATGTAVELW